MLKKLTIFKDKIIADFFLAVFPPRRKGDRSNKVKSGKSQKLLRGSALVFPNAF